MRHWFLVLMIALLPLRGWVGDAMALDMLAQPGHTTMAMQGHSEDHHAMTEENCACDEHGAAVGADHAHSTCDVCNLPALAMASWALQPPAAIHGPLALPAERFASSEAQRGVKPPIS